MLRCPSCIALLPDPDARRCPTCRRSLARRVPVVLGPAGRIGAAALPVDRLLLRRLREQSPARPASTTDAATRRPAGHADPEVQAIVESLYRRARREQGQADDP